MKQIINRLVFLVIFLAVLELVFVRMVIANDALLGEIGSTVYLLKTNDIKMLEEVITIKSKDIDKGFGFPERFADVECVFTFENTADSEIKATVGFPGLESYSYDMSSPPLEDFTIFVDGKKQPVKVKKEIVKYSASDQKGGKVEDNSGPTWYTWDMAFPPKRKIKVVNTYTAAFFTEPGFDPFYFQYILKTGAYWKDSIGHTVIKIIYDSKDDLKRRFLKATPTDYTVKGNKVQWEYENFIPEKDLTFFEHNIYKRVEKVDHQKRK